MQVNVASMGRGAAEQKARDAVEQLANATQWIQAQHDGRASLRDEIKELKSRLGDLREINVQLDGELARVREQDSEDLKVSESKKMELNRMLMRATKEINQVDRVNEDLDTSCRVLNGETAKLKADNEYLREQLNAATKRAEDGQRVHEFEMKKMEACSAAKDEEIGQGKMKIAELEEELKTSREVFFLWLYDFVFCFV